MIRAGGVWHKFVEAVGELSGAFMGDRWEAKLDQDIRVLDLELKRVVVAREEAKAKRVQATLQAKDAREKQAAMEDVARDALRRRRKRVAQISVGDAARFASDAQAWTELAAAAGEDETRLAFDCEQIGRRLALLRQQMDALRAAANLQRTQAAMPAAPVEGTALAAAKRLQQQGAKAPPKSASKINATAETAEQILARLQAEAPSKPTRKSPANKQRRSKK